MRKLAYLLIFLLIATPTIAATDQPVVMNVKTYIYHNPNCKWAKNARRTASKPLNKKPKLKEQGLVKSVQKIIINQYLFITFIIFSKTTDEYKSLCRNQPH